VTAVTASVWGRKRRGRAGRTGEEHGVGDGDGDGDGAQIATAGQMEDRARNGHGARQAEQRTANLRQIALLSQGVNLQSVLHCTPRATTSPGLNLC